MVTHETHICRDCGAEITMPYVRAPAEPRRVRVIANVTLAAVDAKRLAAVISDHYATGRHGWSDHACATAIAIEYNAALAGQP